MNERAFLNQALALYLDNFYNAGSQKRWIISFSLIERFLPPSHQLKNFILKEFISSATNSLANDINYFELLLFQLRIWQQTLDSYSSDEQGLLRLLHIDPLLNYALLTPFNLKQRLIYSVAKSQFVHYAEENISNFIRLPNEHSICRETLNKWLDPANTTHSRLIQSIDQIDNIADKSSRDFRRKHVHRMPPYLVRGIRPNVRIEENSGGYKLTSYIERPLAMQDAIQWCLAQHRLSRIAFARLLKLFRQQLMS